MLKEKIKKPAKDTFMNGRKSHIQFLIQFVKINIHTLNKENMPLHIYDKTDQKNFGVPRHVWQNKHCIDNKSL